MKIQKLVLMLLILAVMGGAALQAAIPASQRAALIALYNATGGDSWTTNTNWKVAGEFAAAGTENTWYGVSTDGGNTYVRNISLVNNHLIGTLPTELGDLTNLMTLSLSQNTLTGSIPTSLTTLTNLTALGLQLNGLSGTIPTNIGNLVNLTSLRLDHNALTGSLPSGLNSLVNLTELSISDNQLDGSIPTLSALTKLTTLNFSGNLLSGTISTSLGSLTNLTVLSLAGNQFSNSIPDMFTGLTKLSYLNLYDNRLGGVIPPSLCTIPSLVTLNISSNMLAGPIPTALTNLTNLSTTATDIGYNALYTSDSGLITFLNAKDSNWAATQTIAPEGVTATPLDGNIIRISWTAIPFTGATGYYAVFTSTTEHGPYTTPAATTTNKTTTFLDIGGLTPNTRYYFIVRTHTNLHAVNQNAVDSGDSSEVTAISRTLLNVRIKGTILLGTTPVPNVVMGGFAGNPVTDSSGVYDVTVPAGWGGTVTPNLLGHTFSPVSRTYSGVTQNQLTEDYTAALVEYTIQGRVTVGGSGLGGVTMNGLPGSPVTNGGGNYTATVSYGFSATVTPTLIGYDFTPASRTYTSVGANQTNQDYAAALKVYTLTVTASNGTVTKSPDQTTYTHGTVVQLTPNPATHYRFVNWSGDATGSDNPLFVTMLSSKSIVANFALVTYTISGTIQLGGSGLTGVVLAGLPGSPSTNGSGFYTATVDYGFTSTATPTKAGYSFSPVSRPYATVGADQLNQDYTATLINYTLTVGGTHGSVTKAPDQATYNYGDSVLLTPVPETGYHFVSWTGDASGSTNPLTVFIDGNKNITATFAINTYTISGRITSSGTGIANVVMSGLTGNPTTDASGYYTATVDYGFGATVTPTLAGYAFTPATMVYAAVDADKLNQDYTGVHAIPASQRAALIALYAATDGAHWTTSTHWKDEPLETDGFAKRGTENTWYGVSTNTFNNYVKDIALASNHLVGTIPSAIGDLTNLTTLSLSSNTLSGSIPTTLKNLTSLTILSLHTNALTGTIPVDLGLMTTLATLRLDNNQLTGSVPAELNSLTNLTELNLAGNQLSGSIPNLSALTKLVSLSFSTNQLTGTIPGSLGSLTNLVSFSVGHNQLTGSIPGTFAALTKLTYLSLGSNMLSGVIPSTLNALTSLVTMNLAGNMLAGPIPTTLTSLTNLSTTTTDIGYNALYTSDAALITFLNTKDSNWASTQTIAPTGVTATALDGGIVRFAWTTIPFTAFTGSYRIYRSDTPGGPYATLAGQTANKTTATLDITDLPLNHLYYFIIQTHSDSHVYNQNAVDSGNSSEVSATPRTKLQVKIKGTVMIGGSTPLADVLMSGLPGDPVTDASGGYEVTLDAGWSGTVEPSLGGYTFSPVSRIYTEITADQLAQNYTATAATPSITVTSPNGGEKWGLGTKHDITWTQVAMSGTATIDLYKAGVWKETLGTANIQGGTFEWTIATSEPIATDYRILVWQGGVSDESNLDFALVRSVKVDFNNDGEEDILWRYQGTGSLQGWNCIWLMNQNTGLSPIQLESTAPEAGSTESLKAAAPTPSLDTPLNSASLQVAGADKTSLTPLGIGDMPVLIQKRVMTTPLEANRDRARLANREATFASAQTMKDVIELNTASSGTTGSPTMGTASVTVSGYLYPQSVSDLGWEIAGAGDFDGNGTTDILWRNYGVGEFTGINCIWYMNGGSVTGYGYPYRVMDVDWRIGATGDFNGDGKTDILWRNYGSGEYSGINCIWYMNGEAVTGYGYPFRVTDLDWKIVGTGDFNKDGKTDILWRNYGSGTQGGFNGIWYMNGDSVLDFGFPYRVLDLNWQIAGTGDFNKDGYTDLIYRYYGTGDLQGMNCIWYLQGDVLIGSDYPEKASDVNWKIVNH